MTDNSAQKPEQLMLAFVHGRICSIQNDYLSASRKPRGARKLATLRHALLLPMGSSADAWSLVFEGLPAELVKPRQCMCLVVSIRLARPCGNS